MHWLLFSLALGMAQADPASGPGRSLRVGPGEALASIAAAVQAARPGDTIRVAAGTYRGPVRIDRPLVLLGDGAVIDGDRRGSAITVAADSVEIRGFTIRQSGRSLNEDDAAIKLQRCTGCRVIDNRIERALHGIYLLESSGVVVRGNEIAGDTALDEARRGNGIHLYHSTGNRIEGNRIHHTRDGIYFSFATHNEVVENTVSRVRYGLHYMYSDDNRFEGNRFARNAAGAAIMFSKRITFRRNRFTHHVGYRAYGILLQSAEEIRAERNRIEQNLVGVFMDNSWANTFRQNAIVANGVGIDLLSSVEGNTFTENVIAHNRTPVRKSVGGGANAWAVDGRGNYWGDPSVVDLDGDGIGDRPHRTGDPFAVLAARTPALELFRGTPAARVFSWAESSFPVFDLPSVVDPAPLAVPPAGAPAAAAVGGFDGRRAALVRVALLGLISLAWLGRRLAVSRARNVEGVA